MAVSVAYFPPPLLCVKRESLRVRESFVFLSMLDDDGGGGGGGGGGASVRRRACVRACDVCVYMHCAFFFFLFFSIFDP